MVGSGMHTISCTPFLEGDWTHTTLLVVPRSIPQIVARPRNPIRAMTTNIKTTTPIAEGIRASSPPDLESSPCLLAIFDFFFFLTIRLHLVDVVVVENEESSLDHVFCRSLFCRRLSCGVLDDDGADSEVDAGVSSVVSIFALFLLLDGESFASASVGEAPFWGDLDRHILRPRRW